ncbi:hypothetical protein [Pseudomonas sp. QD4]|uniref:hypothetical protein n=1 Tax=Pseudomonas sp. QD4 TaxID=3368618 RepID=UPI003B9F9B4E
MQKTINPQGQGELYDQVVKFKNRHLTLYDEFFEDCEWSVKGCEFSYRGLTKGALVKEIRKEFSFTSTSGKKESQILAPFLNLIRSDEYVELQVMDFIDRLRLVVSLVPSGQVYQIKQYLTSHLGHALVLDHHINRPTYVVRDLGASLLRFFQANPEVSKVPGDWGQYHQSYEKKILEDYGTTRQMTDATARYHALRSRL